MACLPGVLGLLSELGLLGLLGSLSLLGLLFFLRFLSLLGLLEISVVDGCTLFRYHVLQADVILARWLVRAQEVSESAAGWTH